MHEPTDMADDLQWRQAFAALPQVQPATDPWPWIARALPSRTRPRTRRRSAWLALAAALGLLAVVPIWRGFDEAMPAPVPLAARPAPAEGTGTPSPTLARTPGSAAAGRDAGARVTASAPIQLSRHTPRPTRGRSTVRTASVMAASVARPGVAKTDVPASISDGAVAAGDSPADATASSAEASVATTHAELSRLHSESARLEALLALARDEHMANGMAVALAADMQAQVAQVDAELGQPELARAAQLDLWRQRVRLLQRLSNFETGQRLLAAHGTPYDPVLVALH